jgi:hypothetical protein
MQIAVSLTSPHMQHIMGERARAIVARLPSSLGFVGVDWQAIDPAELCNLARNIKIINFDHRFKILPINPFKSIIIWICHKAGRH